MITSKYSNSSSFDKVANLKILKSSVYYLLKVSLEIKTIEYNI